MADLTNKTVAFLLTDGYEDVELTEPWKAVTASGATAVLVSPAEGEVHGEKGHSQGVDRAVGDVSADEFDALVLPGGVRNGDTIRMDPTSVALARSFFEQHKPLGVICHGGWLLIEADVVRGRRMTSWPSLQTDLRNAGAEWVDEEVVTDKGFVSSRNPDDLPAFCAKVVEEISEGQHKGQHA